MNNRKSLLPFIFLLFASLIQFSVYAQGTQQVPTEAYSWKNVQMVGGGFVDGIVFHPTAKNVCYCRTDMGGATEEIRKLLCGNLCSTGYHTKI